MRYVFLDVDGVLNNRYTKNSPEEGYINRMAALDFHNIDILKRLMDEIYDKYGRNKVKLILTSSWRAGGEIKMNSLRHILDFYLAKWGVLIDEEVMDLPYKYNRGAEICNYLNLHSDDLEGYLVLDDYYFDDFDAYRIPRHWVHTVYESSAGKGGLQSKHIPYALKMMANPIKEDEWDIIRVGIECQEDA